MPRKVNIVLPSGEVVSVDEDVAARAQTAAGVGSYRETTSEAVDRSRVQVNEERFGGAKQTAITFMEGVMSGLTLGLADPLMADEATSVRAEVNPTARGAGEFAGAVAPAALGGTGVLGGAVRLTPAGALDAGAQLATRGIRGGVRRVATRGAIEGAGQGAGGAVSRATLSDDPLTVESVLSGAGRGSLMGFGLGTVAGTNGKLGAQARRAESGFSASERTGALLDSKNPEFRDAVDALTTARSKAQQIIQMEEGVPLGEGMRELNTRLDSIQDMLVSQPGRAGANGELAGAALQEATRARTRATRAAMRQDRSALDHLSARRDALETAAREIGVPLELPYIPSGAGKVTEELRALAKIRVPSNASDFSTWQSHTAADLLNTLRAAGPDASRALESLANAARSVGVHGDDAVTAASGLHEALRGAANTARSGGPAGRGWGSRFLHRFGRQAGGQSARGAGGAKGPIVGSLLYQAGASAGSYALAGGSGLLSEVAGLRAAVTGRIRKMVAAHGERLGSVGAKLTPAATRLSMSMFGEEEDGDVRDLALARAQEIYRLAPAARDASFAASSPLMAEAGPDFAHAMSEQLAAGVMYLMGYAPKDPGTAHSMGISDWRPSLDQAEEFAARLEAYEDPWMAMERQLAGEGDVAGAETLWQLWPAHMREMQLEVISNANAMRDMPFEKVMALSQAFRTPLDGLLLPQNVAALQSNFIPGNIVQPDTGATGGANGRPSKSEPPTGGTQVQNLTAR